MGFFKGLFVEEVPNEEFYEEGDYALESEECVEASLDEVNTDTLIDDIYAQNDLSGTTNSIFKVEELINSLPKEMVTDTKRASVLATLGVFGLTVTDVMLDGENRIIVLKSVLSQILGDGSSTVISKETEIENHKKEIARLEKEISDQKEEMKKSEDTIISEVERISDLVKFIDGGSNE